MSHRQVNSAEQTEDQNAQENHGQNVHHTVQMVIDQFQKVCNSGTNNSLLECTNKTE